MQDAFKEHFRFALKRLTKVVVEIGKLAAIGIGAFEIAKVEPLAGEVGCQRVGPFIGQHPPRFTLEHRRFVQFVLSCEA